MTCVLRAPLLVAIRARLGAGAVWTLGLGPDHACLPRVHVAYDEHRAWGMSKDLFSLRAHEHPRRACAAVRTHDDEVCRPSPGLVHDLVPRYSGANVDGDAARSRLVDASGDAVERGAPVLEERESRLGAS
jgi:hypothetical protein